MAKTVTVQPSYESPLLKANHSPNQKLLKVSFSSLVFSFSFFSFLFLVKLRYTSLGIQLNSNA